MLIGRYPAAAASVSAQLPAQPDAVPAGLPSELLERRPDVVAAERRVAAAFNRVGEAKAARLPAIALTTGVSAISSDLFVLKDRDNPIWNLGANLLAPLFKGGALKTQVEIRTAEQQQAVAAYAVGRPARVRRSRKRARGRDRRARSRADPRADARRQPARARDRADAVQGRQHRFALRHAAAAGPERHAVRRSSACRPSSACSESTCIWRSAAASNPARRRPPIAPHPKSRRSNCPTQAASSSGRCPHNVARTASAHARRLAARAACECLSAPPSGARAAAAALTTRAGRALGFSTRIARERV